MPRDSRDPRLNGIMQRALNGADAYYDALEAELLKRLGDEWESGSDIGVLMHTADGAISDYADALARLLGDADLAAWVNGGAEVAADLPEPLPGQPGVYQWPGMRAWLPVVSGAVSSLRAKNVMTRSEFDRLDGTLRAKAFTAAGIASTQALDNLREAVVESVENGHGFNEFQANVREAFDTSPLGVGTLDNLFRTNLAVAYAAGQEMIADHPLVRDEFPYAETLPIRDSRLTELCDVIARSGIGGSAVFRRDDPVWQKFKPPRHWRCRCGQRFLSVRDAAERGIAEAREYLKTGRWPATLAFVPPPAVELPKGWASAA